MSSSEEDILVDRGGYTISLPRKSSVLKDNNAILEAQEVVELYLSDPSLWLWLGDLQVWRLSLSRDLFSVHSVHERSSSFSSTLDYGVG